MSEKNKELIFEHVPVLSDLHIPTKPLRNKIVFYKGAYVTRKEWTIVPTIGIDVKFPTILSYRNKNLTIRAEWLCFHLYIGWRQTYPI